MYGFIGRNDYKRNKICFVTTGGTTPTREDEMQMNVGSMSSAPLDMLSAGGGSDDGGFSSDVY